MTKDPVLDEFCSDNIYLHNLVDADNALVEEIVLEPACQDHLDDESGKDLLDYNLKIMGINMIKAKMNMKHNKSYTDKLWKCDECQCMDSQAHIIWYPAFAPLREGKDLISDIDLVHYYQQGIKMREDNENEAQIP